MCRSCAGPRRPPAGCDPAPRASRAASRRTCRPTTTHVRRSRASSAMNPSSRATPADQRSSSIRNGCRTSVRRPPVTARSWSSSSPADRRARRLERRFGIAARGPQRGEAVHQVVGVDEAPTSNGTYARPRRTPAVPPAGEHHSQTGLAQQRRRARVELAARRAESARLEPERRERLDAPREDVALLVGRQRRPLLVAPAVEPELVPARGDLRERVRDTARS